MSSVSSSSSAIWASRRTRPTGSSAPSCSPPRSRGQALRSMAAPGTAYDDPRMGKDPQPAHMDDFVRTSDDNGGVHINSGIPNKAFHLAATAIGGPAWEATGLIWCDVLTGEIATDCDFATFAALTVAAAQARYGEGSTQAAAVADDWQQVGVVAGEGGAPPPRRLPRTRVRCCVSVARVASPA
ncbi:M4 family metallopeptidase [Janibacter limosus]|uniref:M4 family metallopeptidase n=1 Tax=Janibacter limosus TaxID=53458 RepID=UPI0035D990E8